MESNLIYPNVATELLEIFKYLEKNVREKIPTDLENKLIEFKNEEYVFNIDKSKRLNEQELLPETRQILSMIYLKYCCSEDEANEILSAKKNKDLEIEKLKSEKYSIANIFATEEKIEEPSNMEMIVYEEESSVYKKIINKIKAFFEKILRK